MTESDPRCGTRRPISWRSILYVPADNERFVRGAAGRGADAIALDLEDAVPLERKALARATAAAHIDALAKQDVDVLVRINRPWLLAIEDLRAVVRPALSAVVLPKVEHAGQVRALDELTGELEQQAGMAVGTLQFVLLIESPVALPRLSEIASASTRTVAMSVGPEDYAVAAGCAPVDEALFAPNLAVAQAAAAASLWPLGFVGSIAAYDDLDDFARRIKQARALGFRGAFVIHPDQVKVANAGFAVSDDERAWAARVVQAAAGAAGGAFALDGRMIDAPVLERARRILAGR